MKIGFNLSSETNHTNNPPAPDTVTYDNVRCSVVDVYFPTHGMEFAYFNDTFDLHKGDLVYVEGKFEGEKGRVVGVHYTFKILPSQYKRVVHKLNNNVKGELHFANAHLLAFERDVIPKQKISSWFIPPQSEELITGEEPNAPLFSLHELHKIPVSEHIIERGEDYYKQNLVSYIEIDGEKGYAIVEGSKPYELEFIYKDGLVSLPLCPCFYTDTCKHQVALLLQLRETLDLIETDYSHKFNGYFALLQRDAFFSVTAFPNKTSLVLK